MKAQLAMRTRLAMATSFPSPSRGLTLIEVLVGIVIGLLSLIVIFQTVTVWDSRTRAATSGSEAQMSGTLAMFTLSRDLQLAGMGIGESKMDCTVQGYDGAASAPISFPLIPVVIVDGDPTDEPDQIAALYGSSAYFGSSTRLIGGAPTNLVLQNRVGFKAGDLAIAESGSACTLVEVTNDATAADWKSMALATSPYISYYTGSSKTPVYNTASGVANAALGGAVHNLGPRPHRNVWSINADRLGFADDVVQSTGFMTVAEGVIDLKAFYGYDADASGTVEPGEWTKVLPASPSWPLVRAVKFFVLVRGQQYERPAPSASSAEQNYVATNPAYRASDVAIDFSMKDIGGTTDSNPVGPTNWRGYRYAVLERVVPLRNVNWAAAK